jgi:hypothetical protein
MLDASSMANTICLGIDKMTDPGQANNAFYTALCNYIDTNAIVGYSWVAVDTMGIPDPMTTITAKIKTSGTLSPSGATTCESALSAFSGSLNSNASTWTIIWPPGFTLSPAFVIPSITITPSNATERDPAILHVCQEIIGGLKLATTSVPGKHGSYTGTATFIMIV